MRYSLIFVALFSVTTLFGSDSISTDSEPLILEQEPAQVQTSAVEEATEVENSRDGSVATTAPTCECESKSTKKTTNKVVHTCPEPVLPKDESILISVTGQGVAPMNTASPAQAYALAKRAAIADAYRMIAEKVKGVKVDGQDLIKNMMVKRSTIRTSVRAMVRNADVVETTFKEGLCEVEMEITLSHSDFAL